MQGIDWKEAAADAWFVRAKKGGDQVGKTKCGKGCKVIDIVDPEGTPLGVYFAAANRSEVKLIEPLLDNLQIPGRTPDHPLYDKAADSDSLRKRLEERGIELV
ncbi:transposase [Planctomicrobium sp. SH668]|uniref:transposase n=1 Tax=Planctomicrobium sp. SH668 TaxID=3448126 RepID=UPI003F5C0472